MDKATTAYKMASFALAWLQQEKLQALNNHYVGFVFICTNMF